MSISRHNISQSGLDLIKYFEGFSAKPYLCPAGYHTIGYGHVIKSGETFTQIDEIQAESILQRDVTIAEDAVRRHINVPLNSNQFAALVSFTYNLGGGALQRSTLKLRLNRCEYGSIPSELLRWVKAGGRTLKGLVARRKAEGKLFCNYNGLF